eukprot:3302304-Alexandrium_andersonii.AAC.1
MSASLVGSEMCIRDSAFASACLEREADVLQAMAPGEGRTRRTRHHEEAVSYTHLTLPTICSV